MGREADVIYDNPMLVRSQHRRRAATLHINAYAHSSREKCETRTKEP
jgi:hypothetical protein